MIVDKVLAPFLGNTGVWLGLLFEILVLVLIVMGIIKIFFSGAKQAGIA